MLMMQIIIIIIIIIIIKYLINWNIYVLSQTFHLNRTYDMQLCRWILLFLLGTGACDEHFKLDESEAK